jgi:hypothetical protein
LHGDINAAACIAVRVSGHGFQPCRTEHSTQAIEAADGSLLLHHFRVSDASALLAIDGYKEAFPLVSACAALIDDRYQGLSGFFDEDNLKVGENIQNEVNRYCKNAFALVQLIEPLALERGASAQL